MKGIESAFEVGAAVVDGEIRSETPQQRDPGAVAKQPSQRRASGFLQAVEQHLEFGQMRPWRKPAESIDVKHLRRAEAGDGQKVEQALQWPEPTGATKA